MLGQIKKPRWRKRADTKYELHPSMEKWIGEQIIGKLTLKSLRNCWVLIEYLCRMHCGPKVLGRSFCLDRRALKNVKAIGLTESQIRTCIKKLVERGVIVRISVNGKKFHQTSDGLRKKPIIFQLSASLVGIVRSLHPNLSLMKTTAKRLHLGGSGAQAPKPEPDVKRPLDPTNAIDRILERVRLKAAERAGQKPVAPDQPVKVSSDGLR